MTEIIRLGQGQSPTGHARIPTDQLPFLVATAARAPSLLNTQPWLFRLDGNSLEMYADPARELAVLDPQRRELLIACGAALFGLRLAARRLGYVPALTLLPEPAKPNLLARLYLGPPAPLTADEHELLEAVPHRHTHRGPFSPDPLPAGLLAGLQHDAAAEGARLALVGAAAQPRLDALVSAAASWQPRAAQAEVRKWTRPPGSNARDGIAASAYSVLSAESLGQLPPGRLIPRDFDLGRGWGAAAFGGAPPAATAILTSAADTPLDWLRAGQALQRLLLHAATRWVFATLTSQVLEFGPTRSLMVSGLRLGGSPQLVLQFGRARSAESSARRPVGQLLSLS